MTRQEDAVCLRTNLCKPNQLAWERSHIENAVEEYDTMDWMRDDGLKEH